MLSSRGVVEVGGAGATLLGGAGATLLVGVVVVAGGSALPARALRRSVVTGVGDGGGVGVCVGVGVSMVVGGDDRKAQGW